MRYYRNCNEIPVYNFYMTVQKRSLTHLIVGYDEFEDIKVTKEQEIKLSEVWSDIYDDYLTLTNDRSSYIYYELKGEVERLQLVYDIVEEMLKILENTTIPKDLIAFLSLELQKFGYSFDVSNDYNDEVKKLQRQLKISTNKINIKKLELEALEKENKGNGLSLVQQQVKLEQALSRNNIDVKTTVLAKWLAMIDEVKEIVKASKEKNGK